MSDERKFDDGGFAYPQPLDGDGNPVGNVWLGAGGKTLLDWFAGQALVGWLAGPCAGDALDDYDGHPEGFAEHQTFVARSCYGYAEAMVAEKRRREGK